MRKSKLEMTQEDAYHAFDESPYATLTCIKPNGMPYAVHLSIARSNNTLYFHCATEGEKIDALKHHANVCVASVKQYAYANLSTYYISVIIEGSAKEVHEEQEKIEALRLITKRFVPDQLRSFDEEVVKCLSLCSVYKIEIDSITGKKKLQNT